MYKRQVDIGFYGLYDTSGSQDLYSGLFRDATDKKWKIFKDNQAVPTTTVNTSGTGYAVGTLVADIEGDITGSIAGATANMTGLVTYGSLSDGTITVTAFVDDDSMSADSATLIPTQQSIKAYVDSKVTASDLDFQGDSGGALNIDLNSEVLDIAGGTGVTTTGSGNTLTVAIGQPVATSDNVQFANVVATGNLTVNGTTTTINTTNTTVTDSLVEYGTGTSGTPANDAGIVIERGDEANAFMGFDESANKFTVGTGTFTGASTGNLSITTGTLVANIEGATVSTTGNITVGGTVDGRAVSYTHLTLPTTPYV